MTLGAALLRPQDALLIGLVTLSILPIALQLDWLALVDDRNGLAAVLLLVRPLAFLALLGLLPGDARRTVHRRLLPRRLDAGCARLLDLPRPPRSNRPRCRAGRATMLRRGRRWRS